MVQNKIVVALQTVHTGCSNGNYKTSESVMFGLHSCVVTTEHTSLETSCGEIKISPFSDLTTG